MEQAVNLFNEGLLSDTNPMILGNKTLTDCLNGTLVTMNGNEIALQNDMGNIRIDNAYLPSGYEPVGIKEYGGVIYIAAYNPITNKSQIGSFPSPERRINSLNDQSLGTEFKFLEHFKGKQDNNGFSFISENSILLPLTGNNSLHAGDKFTLYSAGLDYDNMSLYITNFNNISTKEGENKVDSPKNKLITLSVGMLNSQNSFVDITKSLKRYKWSLNPETKPKEIENSSFEEFNFNNGYFICLQTINDEIDYTKDTKQLLEERNLKPVNTYSYKLVGPLYLKAQLNHILEFSFDIEGDKNNNTITLYITANMVYNCPDEAVGDGKGGNEIYSDFYCGQTTYIPFDFFFLSNDDDQYRPANLTIDTTLNPVYDVNNNLYTRTITGICTIYTQDLKNSDKIEYFIGVKAFEGYYVENLSSYGTIDIQKLNSGEVNLKGFRFYNDIENKKTILSYTLECYKRKSETLNNLTFKFFDVETNTNVKTISNLEVSNGRNILSFDWENLLPQKLYKIEIYFDRNSNPELLSNRWLLTTELFNDCYSVQSDNFVPDYLETVVTDPNNLNLELINITPEQYQILWNKLKIDFKINYKHYVYKDEESYNTEGGLIFKDAELISDNIFKSSHNYNIEIKVGDLLYINNSILYPNDIYINNPNLKIKDLSTSLEGKILINSYSQDYSYNSINKEFIINSSEKVPLLEEDEDNKKIVDDIKIQSQFKINDVCISKLSSSGYIENYFLKLKDCWDDYLKQAVSYSGFFIATWDHYGDDDEKIFYVVLDSNKLNFKTGPGQGGTDTKSTTETGSINQVGFWTYDGARYDNFGTIDDWYPRDVIYPNILSTFRNINSNKTIAYCFHRNIQAGRESSRWTAYSNVAIPDGDNPENVSNYVDPRYSTKVWIKNTEGGWTLLNNSTNGNFGLVKTILLGTSGTVLNSTYGKFSKTTTPPELDHETLLLSQLYTYLNPNDDLVYCFNPKKLTLSSLGLKILDRNNYIYNLYYTGNYIIHADYIIDSDLNVNRNILNILNFNYGSTIDFDKGTNIKFPIKSNQNFSDQIENAISSDTINNIYIDNDTSLVLDIDGNSLSPDTIYRLKKENEITNLVPEIQSCFSVYKQPRGQYNLLVFNYPTKGRFPTSKSTYLVVHGDDDSELSVGFYGGNLTIAEKEDFE